jgi:hypothetical protein
VELVAGAQFGSYVIERELGRGGMSVVYRAVETQLDRPVALKVMADFLSSDPAYRQRFVAEAKAASRVEHRNVVPIFSFGELEGRFYLAMRHITGTDLRGRLDRDGRLSPDVTLALLRQAAAGLDAVHARDLVHRDVKPPNILIADPTVTGEQPHVYVTDFGIAHRVTKDYPTSGPILGTVSYAAPEQLDGKPVGPAADVYSFGCVLYECLSGGVPFVGDHPGAVMLAHLQTPVPSLAAQRPDLPSAVDDVVAQCMAKEPNDRYPSCRDVVADLAAALGAPMDPTVDSSPSIPPARRPTITGPRPVVAVPRPPWLDPDLTAGRLVGREHQLAALTDAWRDAQRGHRRVVVVAGEAGAGKTRLLGELARSVNESGGSVIAGQCSDRALDPYRPFVDGLRHYARSVPVDQWDMAFGRFVGDLARLLPELADHVDLPPALQSDNEIELYRLFDAVTSALVGLAGPGQPPALVIIDDVHWAPAATCSMLEHVVEHSDGAPMLFVLGLRTEEANRTRPATAALATIDRYEPVVRVDVDGLDDDAVRVLVEDACGDATEQQWHEITSALRSRTDGNPFFVNELLRVVGDADAGGSLDVVPKSVRDVIGLRVSQLPPEVAETLEVAAVIGADFAPLVLGAARQLPRRELVGHLAQAEALGFVVSDTSRYRFAHALVREAVYADLAPTRRQALHADVADAIESVEAARLAPHAAELAFHLRLAGIAADPLRRVHFEILAGHGALQQRAAAEAEAWLHAAADAVDAGEVELDAVARCDLLLDLGEARARRSTPDHRETLLAAIDAAEALGDGVRMARGIAMLERGIPVARPVHAEVDLIERALELVAPDEGAAARTQLLAQLAGRLFWSGQNERRLSLLAEAVRAARELDDPALLAVVLSIRDATVHDEHYSPDELIAACDASGDPRYRFVAHLIDDDYHLYHGRYAEGRAALDRATAIAQEYGDPRMRFGVAIAEARHAMARGDLEAAERLADETLVVGQQVDVEDVALIYAMQIIAVRFLQGRLDELGHLLYLPAFIDAELPEAVAVRALIAVETGDVELACALRDALVADDFARALEVGHNPVMRLAILSQVCVELADREHAAGIVERLWPYRDRNASITMVWATPVSLQLAKACRLLGRDEDETAMLDLAATVMPAGHPLQDEVRRLRTTF